jgi:hypothetical protein
VSAKAKADTKSNTEQQQIKVLEVASGSGTHCEHFIKSISQLHVQPTDIGEEDLASIAARRASFSPELQARIETPVRFDVNDAKTDPQIVSGAPYDVLVCINMIHISPWSSTLGLFSKAAELLSSTSAASVVLYGPYIQDGVETVQSNLDFEKNFLKPRNPEYGLRNLTAVTEVANTHGFELLEVHQMPANNLTVVFQRSAAAVSE